MKSKKMIFIILALLLIGGGAVFYYFYSKESSYNKLTTHEKLIKNGYDFVNETDYIKNINDTDYYLFNLSQGIKYFIVEANGEYQTYFFQNDWVDVEECEYDIKSNKARDNSICSKEQIEKAKQLKQTFNDELEIIKITADDLINLKREVIENKI